MILLHGRAAFEVRFVDLAQHLLLSPLVQVFVHNITPLELGTCVWIAAHFLSMLSTKHNPFIIAVNVLISVSIANVASFFVFGVGSRCVVRTA